MYPFFIENSCISFIRPVLKWNQEQRVFMLNVLKDTLKRNLTWKPVFCFVCCLMLFLLLCLQTCRAYIYLHTFRYFLTQNPKQRSKDQKQVRVDLQGMHTSLTRLHLSLTFKVKNAHTQNCTNTHTQAGIVGHVPERLQKHTHTCLFQCVSGSAGVTWCQTVCGWSREIKPAGPSFQRSSQMRNTPWGDVIREIQGLNNRMRHEQRQVCDWNLTIK